MEAIFLKLLEQLNSAVFVLIAVLIVAFWAVYKLGGIIKTFNAFQDKNKEIDQHITGMKDTLSTIKATTDLLYQTHLSTVKNHSPLSLTSKGSDISTSLKITEMIAKHWADIKAEMEKKSPSNPYDVQTVSMDISRACFDAIFDSTDKNLIKTYAFNHGINLLEIVPIIGIIIRDQYLKEKGMAIEEIDIHDPQKA